MSDIVPVFVHGINVHLPKREELRRWREALADGYLDPEQLGLRTTFGYYADWFFKQPNLLDLDEAHVARIGETAALIEMGMSDGPPGLGPQAREAVLGLDVSTFVPQRLIRLFLKDQTGPLFGYFGNDPVVHPELDEEGHIRDVIRARVVAAIREARDNAGENGKVIVLAHSMGSIVAWDVIAHDEDCPEVDGLITIGSPLALDFVQRGLKSANGDRYNQHFPEKLTGDWYNIVARHDLVGSLDVDFAREFGKRAIDQKIHGITIDNPELMTTQGTWQRIRSAHSLTGYLRHPQTARALRALSERDIGGRTQDRVEESAPRRGDRRMMQVARDTHERYRETEARRREISAGKAGRLGVAQFETRERIIKKLSLLDVPKGMAKSLLDQARDGTEIGTINLERILGSNDFIPSSFALKAAALTSAVGKLDVSVQGVGSWSGTGFMISENLMMTNNHVLASPQEAAAASLMLDYSLSSEEEEHRATRYALRPDLFFVTSDSKLLDYTIVMVDAPAEGLRRPWFQLISGSGKALLGDSINIIQHPAGRRQEIVVRNSEVTFVDDGRDYVYYEADTEGGSSGSPVCNDQWQLAFLHHSSVPERDDEGFVLKKNGQRYLSGEPDEDINWISNEGIRISRIIKDARERLLSKEQHAIFDGCFEDPDLTRYIHIAPDTFGAPAGAAGAEGMGGPAGGAVGGPGGPVAQGGHGDGAASWLFELSFGPAGGVRSARPVPRAAATAAAAPAGPLRAPLPRPAPPQAYSPVSPKDAALRDTAARLIDKAAMDEGYYDETRDAASIEAYYMDMPTKGSPVALFNAYRKLLRTTHRRQLSYSRARLTVLYPHADRHKDGTLRSIYSGEALDPADVIATELATILRSVDLPMLGQEMLIEGDWLDLIINAADSVSAFETSSPFNCEHAVPQSWFGGRQPMKADLHHLFTCEPRCNSFRNNFAYGEFGDYEAGQLDPDETALRALCGFRDLVGGETHFEPERNKGAVARATLYFLLRYPGEIGDANNEYTTDDLKMLTEWHEEDGPSEWERHRNRAIFLSQGNRNPLIDMPDLGEEIGFYKGIEP